MRDRRVFDAHFHVGAFGVQREFGHRICPIPPEVDHRTGEDCVRYLQRNGLAGGVIIPTYLRDPLAAYNYNRLVRRTVAKSGTLLGGLWVSPVPEPAVEAALAATLADLPQPGIRALKIASNTWLPYSIDPGTWSQRLRRNMERILEAARSHALVVHCHSGYLSGAQPLAFEAFMRSYGHAATYQFVHMGEAIAPVFAFVPRFLQWIEGGFQVYTDVSLVPGFGPRWLLVALDRRNLGFDRVLFATDAPWGRFAPTYAKVQSLDVDQEVRDKIFWNNAADLYGLA